MAGLVTVLQSGQTLRPDGVFSGPWREFRRIPIPAGGRESIVGDGAESAVFVMSGSVTARIGDTDTTMPEGRAMAVGLGSRVDLVAGPDGAELFVTTLDVQLGSA